MKVLFFTQTSGIGASARYRVYQYLDYLEKNGISCTVSPAISDDLLGRYNKSRNIFVKYNFYLSQALKRIGELRGAGRFDVVFLQRDVIMHFYPVIEKLIALSNKNIIFDFDDAIYIYPPDKKINLLFGLLWDKRKIERIIRLSRHVIAGNNSLKRYAEKFTRNVTVIPTSIDTSSYKTNRNLIREPDKTVNIGWIGSQGTFHYIEALFPVFQELAKKYKIELRVIGARGRPLNGVKVNYIEWDPATEINEISRFHIGLMPLSNDEWSRGKSATKLLQYMASGVPAVASGVGTNAEIIKDNINGLLADSKESWIRKISMLIEEHRLRSDLAERAVRDVENLYSVQANAPRLLQVIKSAASGN